MNVGRIVKVTVAAGIVYSVFDYVINNYVLSGMMAGMASILNPAPSMLYYLVLDLAAALVVALLYDKVHGSFGAGVGGGLTFGFYAGLVANIPIWIGLHVFIKDISYGTAWAFTIAGVAGYMIMGAIASLVEGMGEAKKA
jgi:hypothetical protein